MLVCRCLQNAEPVLLVGETGTGKTTVCQMAALMRGQRLHILNCNQHTETSDFLGGFRPARWGSALTVCIPTSFLQPDVQHLQGKQLADFLQLLIAYI